MRRMKTYAAFKRVIDETWQQVPLRILAIVAMPNHWHFVVKPSTDSEVSEFARRLTVTHTMRWHTHYNTGGHLYQGRFKSFPIQSDQHLLTVMRYVERNPLRANFIEQAEDSLKVRPQPLARFRLLQNTRAARIVFLWLLFFVVSSQEAMLEEIANPAALRTGRDPEL